MCKLIKRHHSAFKVRKAAYENKIIPLVQLRKEEIDEVQIIYSAIRGASFDAYQSFISHAHLEQDKESLKNALEVVLGRA